jgi:hypothetical protein
LCLAISIPLGVLAWPYASPYLDPYLGKILPFVFPTATPTLTLTPLPTSTATEKPTPLPTETPTPKLTDTLTPTPTLTQLPTDTNTPEPTPTFTLTPIPPIQPLLTDQFTQPLTVTWDIWGEPVSVLLQDPRPALQLSSIAGSLAGVSGIPIITLSPGLTISFTASINTPTATLFLDWDAGVQTRLPGAEPGSIHLAIEPTQVSLRLIQASNNRVVTCSSTTRTEGTHTYLIRLGADESVSLYQDNIFACSLPGPVAGGVDNQGRISFSGNGTVENILVFVQP